MHRLAFALALLPLTASAQAPKAPEVPADLPPKIELLQPGVKLTLLSQEQADYIGVPVQGPYKPDHYRY